MRAPDVGATNAATMTVVERIRRDFKVINLGIFFDEATRNHADEVAIIDLTDAEPRSYTYAELETRGAPRGAGAGVRRPAQATSAASSRSPME